MLQSLQDTISTYKLSIYVKNMLTEFHEIQGPVTYFFQPDVNAFHRNVKKKQKICFSVNKLEYLLGLNHHARTIMLEVDMISVFPYYGLEKEKSVFFDIKCHDSYFMKCLHNNITQNDTIW